MAHVSFFDLAHGGSGLPEPQTLEEAKQRIGVLRSQLTHTAQTLDDVREDRQDWKHKAGIAERKVQYWYGQVEVLSAVLMDVKRFYGVIANSLPVNLEMVLEAAGVDPDLMEVTDG